MNENISWFGVNTTKWPQPNRTAIRVKQFEGWVNNSIELNQRGKRNLKETPLNIPNLKFDIEGQCIFFFFF